MQAWDSPALFGRVKSPLRSEKSLRFFRLRLQGVTHYTLPCKEPCARRSLWTPLWQVLRPAILRLAASDKRTAAYIIDTQKTITELGVKKSSTRLAKTKDVVIASAGQGKTRGQVAYCFIDTFINQSIISMRSIDNIDYSNFIFFNLLSRYDELRLLSDSSSSRGSLTVKIMEDVNIILPSNAIIYKFSSKFDFKNL